MAMTWETNVDAAYRAGMYILEKKEIFIENDTMISNLNNLCESIIQDTSNNIKSDPKIKKYVKSFQTVLSKFEEKNKLIETGKKYNIEKGWIFDQILKLLKANESNNVKKQKSEILLDKINFYHSSIVQINKILNDANKEMENLNKEDKNIIVSKLKKILKLTEDYNISKLKRAAKKFQQSKALKDFKFGRIDFFQN